MNFTLRQLQLFEAVARNASFTRAAEEMHLTQPAVSTQVKQLEEDVGTPLFEHMGRKIFLTEAGREMYEFSRNIAQKFTDIGMVLDEMKGVKRGMLNISVTSTAKYFAPYLLAAFCRQHTGITVNLDVTNRETLLRQLADNTPDMAIMGKPPDGLDLKADSFMSNPLVVIAPPDHPLVKAGRIALDRLLQERFIVREQGSGTRNAIERFLQHRGLTMTTTMEMSRNEAIKHAVMAGLGLGIVSIHTLEMEFALGRLAVLNVEGFPILKDWYVVHRTGKRFSAAAEAFKAFVLNEGGNLIQIPQPRAAGRSRTKAGRQIARLS
ncbi:LysR family transcriptional regulator [Sulfuriferula sp.]|uniref:LysR family transcriptional regulator n=1 Tax=Sulfuriferula sp. TaxID=2025307 RepID=UPI00272EFACC|nr:LysR family transcriptional regulator [Sulfuriferula sp.]MDP2027489.1 LysR family transcriptional regulator [Sulfuriferula sp.]